MMFTTHCFRPVSTALLLLVAGFANAAESSLVRVVDLNLGESAEVTLANGAKAGVKLLDVQESHDAIRAAVRAARVKVEYPLCPPATDSICQRREPC